MQERPKFGRSEATACLPSSIPGKGSWVLFASKQRSGKRSRWRSFSFRSGSVWARRVSNARLLVGSVLVVLIVELLNTGIETVVDRIGLERHELSGLAKDVGSTAVLLSLTL